MDGHEIPKDTYSARLLLIRHDLGLTVDEISAQCDIPSATWSSWESGKVKRPQGFHDKARQIARATGYDLNWLLYGWETIGAQTRIGGFSPDASDLQLPLPLALNIAA